MRRKVGVIVAILVVLAAVGGAYAAASFDLRARQSPSQLEGYVAAKAKRWLVARAVAREGVPPELAPSEITVASGHMQYGGSCASCHGQDGTTPTKMGLSMYPPVPGLGGPDAQRYSNAELFWIIKNGIRNTGMPGFGEIHSDTEIWHLVHYVRSLD
ncbi:MAG: cytochrome c [Acidobacteria bacterium]|nr:cytochrome c [Acidobacteriota bacterium]